MLIGGVKLDEKVFISYSWENEDVVDKIDDFLLSKGIKVIRDKRDTEYKDSFKKFMKQVRETDYVLMVISDDYLKSKNCMYEVLEFIKDDDYKERILPIVLSDAEKIYNPSNSIDYLKYWDNKEEELNKTLKKVDPVNATSIFEELRIIRNIQGSIMDFISTISDMKNIPFGELEQNNYKEILEEITDLEAEELSEFNYTVLKQKEVGHAGAKRYSARVLVDRTYTKEQIKSIIKEITEELKDSMYYRNQKSKEYWGDTKAHVIWLYIAFDLEDVETANWVCRTSWISDELDEDMSPIELNGNDEIDDIAIKWNDSYEENREYYAKHFGKKENVLEKIDSILNHMKPIADNAIEKFFSYKKGQISEEELIEYMQKHQETIDDLYYEAGDIPHPPVDCQDYDDVSQNIFADIHNMFLYYSEDGIGNWDKQTRKHLMNDTIEKYKENLQRLKFEKEKLN